MGQQMRATLRGLWQSTPFRRFWIANTISSLGTSAYVMAVSWLTVRMYGSHGIALLALGYGIPQLVLELVGGAAADRTPRRKLYILTETSLFLLAAVLWLASTRGNVSLWLLVGVSACNGVISAFDTPARTALIGELVGSNEQVSAQQAFSVSSQLTTIFGPALGGILLSLGHHGGSNEQAAFFFNCFSYLPILLCFPFLPSPSQRQPHQQAGPRRQLREVLRGIRQGLVVVRQGRSLRVLMQLLAVVMVLGGPFQTLLPIFVHESLALGSVHTSYAALLSAVGLGGLAGSLLGLASGEQRQRFLALAIGAVGLGLSLLLLASTRVIHWASLSAFLAGACSIFTINLDTALLQGMTPPEMQGRVSSIASLGKGLQSLSAAAASEAIALLNHLFNHSWWHSNTYALVQGGLAVGLLAAAITLWAPLASLAEPATVLSSPAGEER